MEWQSITQNDSTHWVAGSSAAYSEISVTSSLESLLAFTTSAYDLGGKCGSKSWL